MQKTQSLTGAELRQLRNFFNISISEASVYLEGRSGRPQWRQYENSYTKIPDHITEAILEVTRRYNDILKNGDIPQRSFLDRKIHQAVYRTKFIQGITYTTLGETNE